MQTISDKMSYHNKNTGLDFNLYNIVKKRNQKIKMKNCLWQKNMVCNHCINEYFGICDSFL
jgi:hypothetical protein